MTTKPHLFWDIEIFRKWAHPYFSIFHFHCTRHLGGLLNLQHVRLEAGPAQPSVHLSTALVKLHQLVQLELVAFPLHRTLREVVAQLPRLNLLNLAPSAEDQASLAAMNQVLLSVMKEGHIWCGEWGALVPPSKTCHSTSHVIPVLRAHLADSVLYKAASRRGQGDLLMISMAEARLLLQDCLPDHGVVDVYTVSHNTAHWLKMCS